MRHLINGAHHALKKKFKGGTSHMMMEAHKLAHHTHNIYKL